MVKLQHLSTNLLTILQPLFNNQDIVKYLNYDVKNPLSQPNLTLPVRSLLFSKVYPIPFDIQVTDGEGTQIRVYYPQGRFKNGGVVEDTLVHFDIVASKTKDIWLVNDGTPLIRPYELMKLIVGEYHDKSIGTVGKLYFTDWKHLYFNSKYDCIRMYAKMMTLGSG
jgi:hypothetical protein